MDIVTLGIFAYLLGMVASVLYPYLSAYLENGQKFDFKYAISRIIGTLILGLAAVVAPGFTEWLSTTAQSYDYTGLYLIFVFLTTFGVGSLARETQKLGSAMTKKVV